MDIRETPAHPCGWKENQEKMILTDPEDTEYEAHFVVCECCSGTGSCVNPSIDSHGISSDEFDEDPDFREQYFSGGFDITCPHCKGLRVVLRPSTEEGIKSYEESEKSQRAYAAEIAAERAMGC